MLCIIDQPIILISALLCPVILVGRPGTPAPSTGDNTAWVTVGAWHHHSLPGKRSFATETAGHQSTSAWAVSIAGATPSTIECCV